MANTTIIEIVYHVSLFVIFVYTAYIQVDIPGQPDTYRGLPTSLTISNMYLSIIYYGFSIVIDVTYYLFDKMNLRLKVKIISKLQKCRKIRDYIYSSIVFPTSISVCIGFWCLTFSRYNPEAFDERIKYVPLHGISNHGVHTLPFISTLLELYIRNHRSQISFLKGILGWLVCYIGYLIWILWIEYHAGVCAYPILKVMSVKVRVIVFVGYAIMQTILYQIGVTLTRSYWGMKVQ